MRKSLLIEEFPAEELFQSFTEVKEQIKKLEELIGNKGVNDELLTRTQTCKFLQIDSSTLWHWTNKGKVKAYGIANRRYYKRSELIESLTPLKK